MGRVISLEKKLSERHKTEFHLSPLFPLACPSYLIQIKPFFEGVNFPLLLIDTLDNNVTLDMGFSVSTTDRIINQDVAVQYFQISRKEKYLNSSDICCVPFLDLGPKAALDP